MKEGTQFKRGGGGVVKIQTKKELRVSNHVTVLDIDSKKKNFEATSKQLNSV